jgi:hypothetical protein
LEGNENVAARAPWLLIAEDRLAMRESVDTFVIGIPAFHEIHPL